MYIKKISALVLALALAGSTCGMCWADPTYTLTGSATEGAHGVWTATIGGSVSWGASDSKKNTAGSQSGTPVTKTADTCLGAAQAAITAEVAQITTILDGASLTDAAQKALAKQEQTAIDNILKPCE